MAASGQLADGLEGVVVAETTLSEVDGEKGKLIIAGHDVETLAQRASFEEAAWALWNGSLPDSRSLKELTAELGRARVVAHQRLGEVSEALKAQDGMDALRAAVGLGVPVPAGGPGPEEGILLTASMAVFAAAWARVRSGRIPLPPDPNAGHAADYLRMATGRPHHEEEARALDAYLVTVSDHGMNASTFTARVVASTGSDAVSATVAAIGALKGPLHGGAPGPVLDMLDQIAKPENALPWLEGELAAKRRIMGMGHRIYRVRDPRAAVLEKAIERLEKSVGSKGRLALARAVEKAAEGALRKRYPNRPLAANVEFYTAVLLDAVGFEAAQFSPTFAVGRVAGWYAHIQEQRKKGRLIRPASRYVGARPEGM